MTTFRALVLHEEGGKVVPRLETAEEAQLPAGDVTVRVEYSTLNYKDGMIVRGIGRLVRQYPHVPGIDFAGTVESSASPQFKPGDPVVLTGVARIRVTSGGKPNAFSVRFTDVYANRGGKWQMVTWQSTRLAE